MKSCLSAISNLLAAACAILFVITAAVCLPAFILERNLFSPAAYKQALRDQHTYERMPALIAEQIIYEEAKPTSRLVPELKRLTQSDWESILSDLLTEDDLRIQAESLIDDFFRYVDPRHNLIEASFSLSFFIQKLDGEAGYRAALHLIAAQPACSANEWSVFIASGSTQFEDMPTCRPPAEVMAVAEPYIRDALHSLSAAIPYEITYKRPPTSNPTAVESWRLKLQMARYVIWLSLLLPLSLLVLTAVFGVRSLAGGGFWLGLPLALAGLSTFAAALVVWRLPGWLIARFAFGGKVTIEGVAPGVTQMLVDVVTSIVHSAARTIGIAGVVLVLLGAGLLVAGVLFGAARRGL